MKGYSIAHLLSKQPKSLKKNKHYREMLYYYQTSPKLQKVRFSRRCYSLLLHAKIKPENLKHFYRTYRLPKDPFFPLYFAVKREYLEQKERRKKEKVEYIAKKMRSLPPNVLSFIKYLAEYEKLCNYSGRCPVWNDHLFPKTKKRVREYHRFTIDGWSAFFTDYLALLSRRYRTMGNGVGEKLLACFILECLPELPAVRAGTAAGGGGKSSRGTAAQPGRSSSRGTAYRPGRRSGSASGRGSSGSPAPPYPAPPAEQVVKNYRRLSKLHHPDQGGDAETFVRLKWARDTLSE
jgi:hypothetical protein